MARHTISIPSLTAAFALMATFGVSINADAQTGNERAHAQESALDEVVVTSRRREENLQSVPISIQAINSEDLQLRGMERIQDVIAQTPNVFTASNPLSTSNFSMRGIPNVGVFVDGIWQRSGVLLNQRSTLELASVEILRGPQGTLYGRDSTGGAIRLITQLPSDRFGARLVGTTGSYRRLDLTANVDIPISDTLLTKWSASRETRDGYIQSLSVNRAYGEIDNKDLRGDILWKPSDSFKVRLTAQKSLVQSSDTMVSTLLIDPGTPGVGNNLGYIVHPRQYYQLSGLPFNNLTHASGYPGGQVGKWQTKSDWNSGPGTIIDTKNLTLKMDYRLTSSITLTSLTGYVRQTDFAYEDYDASAYQFQQAANMNQLRTTTQEFQLTGAQGRFNWVAGLYGWNLYNNNRSFRWALLDINVPALQATPQCRAPRAPGVLACATLPNNDTFTGNSENGYAAFGEVTAKLVRGLSLTLGARYQKQRNETWTDLYAPTTVTRARSVTPGALIAPLDQYFDRLGTTNPVEVQFSKATYRWALTNQFTDDLMAYLGYSEGFNAGGTTRIAVADAQNRQVLLDFPFKPEKLANYEIGLRSDWLEHRLRVNATVFHTDWTDLQLRAQINNPFTGAPIPSSPTQNVAKARAQGAELTVTARPIPSVKIDLGAGYLDTRYTQVQAGITSIHLGDKFGLAPKYQYNLGVQWNRALARGNVVARLDYAWTDAYIRSYAPDSQINGTNPDRPFDQSAFGRLNARFAFTPPSGKWEVALFGTNLTDQWYLTGGFDRPILAMDVSEIGRPRELGLTLKLFLE